MANLDRIVNVQIALNTGGVSQIGFSTAMVVGAHFHSLARSLTYTSVDDMLDDGFTADDPVYLAASAYLSQTPRQAYVKVGRIACDSIDVTVANVLPEGTYSLEVQTRAADGTTGKTTYEYVNTGGDAAAIAKGLAAKVSADKAAPVSASANDKVITVKKKSADFALKATDNLRAAVGSAREEIAAAMNAITGEDDDFYGIVLASRNAADVLAMAEWTESHTKIFVTATAEEGAKDRTVTTDIGSQLQKKEYYRTMCWYHELADTEYLDAAVMGRVFAIKPGAETWANKRLSAISADNLTETEFQALAGKNINTFERFRNISITQTGKVAAGEWTDVIRFRDWLVEEIKTNVFTLLINRDKVPYLDSGITAIESVVRKALKDGQDAGGIAADEYDENGDLNLGFDVSVPLAANITPNQKASRILKDVEFVARLAGAIHAVQITGSLTYENIIQAS